MGPLVRIAIMAEAFDAIAAAPPLAAYVTFEDEITANDERLVWLEQAVLDRLNAKRAPGESYSDVILRLVEMERLTRK
jgi:hypothetical protein